MPDIKENECDKAESGKHEPDFDRLELDSHLGSNEARFETTCLHCGTRGETVIHHSDFDWSIGE